MDYALLTSLKQAGVKECIISILEDEEFDTVDILNNTSDDLLKSCNIKGGQIVRIRNALSAMPMATNVGSHDFQIVHENEWLDNQPENELPPWAPTSLPPTTPTSSRSSSPFLSIRASTPGSSQSSSPCTSTSSYTPTQTNIPSELELPEKVDSQTPSHGFAIKVKRAAKLNWIKDYKLPGSFSPKVNEDLKSGKLTGNCRDEFTRDIVSSMKVHTMYPATEEKQKIASMIIQEYPFLADSIGAGTGSWCKAITNRFKNLRRKKVVGNSMPIRKNPTTPTSEPHTKKRKFYEVPQLPEGETLETCEEHRKVLVKEMTKTKKNLHLIKELMDITFAHRRQQLLNQAKRVETILEEYPALQLISEVKAEFGRVLSDPKLVREMTSNFKLLEEKLLKYVGKCTKRSAKTLRDRMERALEDEPDRELDIKSTVAALMLQDLLKEKAADLLFFKVCTDDDMIDAEIAKTTFPRLIGSGDLAQVDPLCIAIEGQRWLDLSAITHNRLPMASVLLLGSFYIFNIEYPSGVSNVYALLEAMMLKRTQEAKKRISVQRLLKDLDICI